MGAGRIAAVAVAVAAALALAGCGTSELFGAYDVPEAPGTAEAPWPRLVDTPTPPPAGEYTAAVPDPAEGVATGVELNILARSADARATPLAAPVVDDRQLRARAAAAQARARRLAAPVLTDAERQRLLAATRR